MNTLNSIRDNEITKIRPFEQCILFTYRKTLPEQVSYAQQQSGVKLQPKSRTKWSILLYRHIQRKTIGKQKQQWDGTILCTGNLTMEKEQINVHSFAKEYFYFFGGTCVRTFCESKVHWKIQRNVFVQCQ